MTLIGSRRTRLWRHRLAAFGSAAVLALVAGCGGGGPETTEDGLTTARISTASHSMAGAAVLAGMAMDTYRAGGIALEDVPAGGSSTNVVSAVLSGDAQFGFVGATTAVDAIQEGAPITIIGGVTHGMQELVLRPDVAERLAPVTPESPVQDRVQALRGLTIATSPAGSTNNAFLTGILASQGLDPARDVTIVPSDPAAIVAGIRDGLYDGGFWSPGVLEQNLADGSGVMWINTPRGELPKFKQSYQALTITSKRTAESEPELVERFIRATQAAAQRMEAEEQAAQDAVYNSYFPRLERATYDLTWDIAEPSFIDDQLIGRQDFANHLELQAEMFGGTYDRVTFAEAVHPIAQRPQG